MDVIALLLIFHWKKKNQIPLIYLLWVRILCAIWILSEYLAWEKKTVSLSLKLLDLWLKMELCKMIQNADKARKKLQDQRKSYRFLGHV